MAYFNKFQVVPYDINGDGIYDHLTNLTSICKISDTLKNDATKYDFVEIYDGERPEQLSYRLYGSTEYYWTFLMLNDGIKNIWNDWPKSSRQLVEYCEGKYPGVAAITSDSLFTVKSSTGETSTKFSIGEEVRNSNFTGTGIIREIHRNNNYLIIDVTAGNFDIDGEAITGSESEDSVACSAIVPAAYAPKYHIAAHSGVITQPLPGGGTHAFTNFNYESMLNDKNKNIRAIKPIHIIDVAEALTKELS